MRAPALLLLVGCVLAVCLGHTALASRRHDVLPSERWPHFYGTDWAGIQPVYTSDVRVNWMAPFFSGGGLGSESTLIALGLEPYLGTDLVIDQHGGPRDYKYINGVERKRHRLMTKWASRSAFGPLSTMFVCQSNPDMWQPKPKELPGNPCPAGGAIYKIGRTHTETDRLPMDWAAKMNKMDEIWVPTRHHRDLFIDKGVYEDKLVVVPQPADLEFFNPATVKPMSKLPGGHEDRAFKFLSVLNWEHRKGWDLLLRAYLSEFSFSENVVLYLLTPEHKTTESLWDFLQDSLNVRSFDQLPRIEAVPYVSQRDMPKLYKAMDAFVLPTRGEGWGRTITEAMCMELPVIATKWSGPSEYLTQDNSYPIRISSMKSVPDGENAGHKMGEPDLHQLRDYMRHVVDNPKEAKARGRRARVDMKRYSPERVGRFIAHHLSAIADSLDGEVEL